MGRIKENDRLPVLDAHAGHWTEANALPDGPVILTLNTDPPTTLSLAQFETHRDDYEAKSEAENDLQLPIDHWELINAPSQPHKDTLTTQTWTNLTMVAAFTLSTSITEGEKQKPQPRKTK